MALKEYPYPSVPYSDVLNELGAVQFYRWFYEEITFLRVTDFQGDFSPAFQMTLARGTLVIQECR